jgi:hypothetical protein
MSDHRDEQEDQRPRKDARAWPFGAETTESEAQGEGNYDATRTYNAATQAFVDSGRVDEAAQRAAPADEGEAAELLLAEQAAKERAREEDPAVDRGRSLR